MATGRRVHLVERGQAVGTEAGGQADERGPETPMNIGDLAADHAADENVGRRADRAGQRKDLVTSPVAPPAPVNRFASHSLGETRHGTSRPFEDDAVALDEASSGRTRQFHTPYATAVSSISIMMAE